MILTQTMIDRLSRWERLGDKFGYAVTYLPPFTTQGLIEEKYLTRFSQFPAKTAEELNQLLGREDVFVSITFGIWEAYVGSEDDGFFAVMRAEIKNWKKNWKPKKTNKAEAA